MSTRTGHHRRRQRIVALTEEARRDPVAFRRKLRRLMGLANLYVRGVILVLALIVFGALTTIPQGGGLAALFLILFAGSSLYFVITSISAWSKVDTGVRLRRSQLPELFDLIDDVRKTSGLKALHGIHLSDDFNAMVTVTRRRAVFGRMENHLIVGVPLMHALSAREFRAVLAHECGHLSGDQSRDLLAMAQLEALWQNVSTGMGGTFGGMLFGPFFRWFNPKFTERRVVYRREEELAADHEGLLQTDHETAMALEVRLAVAGLKLQQLVQAERRRLLRLHDEPPKGLTKGLCELAATPLDEDDRPFLVLALAQATGWRDTHPALSERLEAMGADPNTVALPDPVEEHAAEVYIGGHIDRLCDALDAAQRPKIEAFWKLHHTQTSKDLETLRQLDQDARFAELSADDMLKRALLLAQYEPDEARTLAELEAVYASGETTNIDLLWALGQARLKHDDPSGIALVEESVTLRPDITAAAFATLAEHHARAGDVDATKEALATVANVQEEDAAIEEEARRIDDMTPVEPHRLQAHELVGIRHPLEKHEAVAEAWLVKRKFDAPTLTPRYILMVRDSIEGTAFFPGRARAELYVELAKTMAALDGHVSVVPLHEGVYGLWRRMANVPGARVYLRPGEAPYN